MVHVPLRRLERRMDGERHVEVLGGREDRVVMGIAVGDPGDRERAHEGAAAAVGDGAPELARGLGGVAQGQMRDRDEAAAGVAAEVGDPAVVGAAVRARELGVDQLGFPQEAQRGIQHGPGEALPVEELHALWVPEILAVGFRKLWQVPRMMAPGLG